MSKKFELKNLATGKTSELQALSGTIGPDALDISHLIRDQGVFTYDPGFMATASTESKIDVAIGATKFSKSSKTSTFCSRRRRLAARRASGRRLSRSTGKNCW